MSLLAKKLLISFAFLAIVSSGCVSSTATHEFQDVSKSHRQLCRIAVLPFVNDTDYIQGDVILYRIFMAELNYNRGLTVIQEGDVRKMLRQMKVSPKATPTFEQVMILADRLAVDGIVSGKIVKMEDGGVGNGAPPLLAVDLKVLDAVSGKTLLTVYHSRSGEDYRKVLHFGMVYTITELARLVSTEILDGWFERGSNRCTD